MFTLMIHKGAHMIHKGVHPFRLSHSLAAAKSSVMSDSVQLHRSQPAKLPRPWDSPGKNTGVGCHFLLQCMKVKSEREVAQSCPTLSDPMDCSPPGSSIHGIFQARGLEWGAIAFSAHSQRSSKKRAVQIFIYKQSILVLLVIILS